MVIPSAQPQYSKRSNIVGRLTIRVAFVAALENILELGESLVPVPVQLSSCLDEIWESLLIEELHPKGSAVHVDFSFPGPTRKLVFFWEFVVSAHSLSWLQMGSFSKILAILADSMLILFACLSVRYSCNYSALPRVDESKATIKREE